MSLVSLHGRPAAALCYVNDYSEVKLLSVDAETGKPVDNEVGFDRSVYRVYPFGGTTTWPQQGRELLRLRRGTPARRPSSSPG